MGEVNSQEVRFSGKSLDKVLSQASAELGIPKDQMEYRVVSQTNGGLLSFWGKKIELAVKKPSSAKSSPRGRAPRQGTERRGQDAPTPLSPEETESLVEDLVAAAKGICERMFGSEIEVAHKLEDSRLVIDMRGEDLAELSNRQGKFTEAMEHLLRKMPRHLKRELPFRIFVDINGTRVEREEELINLAKDLSIKVFENKKPIVLNYKSSYDRKIIHMALDKDERVYTKSIGSGLNRKLMIVPHKQGEEEQMS